MGLACNAKLAHLKHAVASAVRAGSDRVVVNQELAEELTQWSTQLKEWNGAALIVDQAPDWVVETDASDRRWGFHCLTTGQRHGSPWSETSLQHHINIRELKAALLSLRTLAETNGWRDGTILLRADNTVTVAVINKVASKNQHLFSMATELHAFLAARRLRIVAEHISGEENTEADFESRREVTLADAQLRREAFAKIQRCWPDISVDAMATAENKQLESFISWKPEAGCAAVDFLSCPLSVETTYFVNPPIRLMQRVLNRIRHAAIRAVVVAPQWPSATWWPDLLQMATEEPLTLGPVTDCYATPLVEDKTWTMLAVRLSGKRADE